MTEKIKVQIWSDLICPWCWIGKRRFEKALMLNPERDRYEIIHRAYRLEPGGEVRPVEEALAQKFGQPDPSALTPMFTQVEDTARTEGLEYHLSGTLYGDTKNAQILSLWAQSLGKGHEYVEACHKAYFTDGLDIFDSKTLVDLAASLGLDRTAAHAALKDPQWEAQILADESEARELGARGVPFFIFDDKFAVGGAQGPELFAQVFAKLSE